MVEYVKYFLRPNICPINRVYLYSFNSPYCIFSNSIMKDVYFSFIRDGSVSPGPIKDDASWTAKLVTFCLFSEVLFVITFRNKDSTNSFID